MVLLICRVLQFFVMRGGGLCRSCHLGGGICPGSFFQEDCVQGYFVRRDFVRMPTECAKLYGLRCISENGAWLAFNSINFMFTNELNYANYILYYYV